jgi:two-component system, chemotaxis family, chemotaxis protein CheY
MSSTLVSEALVMDDNFHNRYIFRIALENVGFNITEAENGAEGLKILAERTFHVLVLDLHMPLLDGVGVLKELRNMPIHSKMRVIVVTANAHMATGEVSELSDYVMYKPINVVEFSEFAKRLKKSLLAV